MEWCGVVVGRNTCARRAHVLTGSCELDAPRARHATVAAVLARRAFARLSALLHIICAGSSSSSLLSAVIRIGDVPQQLGSGIVCLLLP